MSECDAPCRPGERRPSSVFSAEPVTATRRGQPLARGGCSLARHTHHTPESTETASEQKIASISVVLPVRNRAALVKVCLEYLLRAARPAVEQGVSIEIIVANDASTDGTAQAVKTVAQEAFLPVRLITLPTRQGPARARNAALATAEGDLVIFVDSDVIVTDGFFAGHLAVHESADEPVYANGTLITVPDLDTALSMPSPTVWDYSGATLDTANASVPLKHLQAVGFFDSGFEGMGWQDLDLGKRLLRHGLKRMQAKDAVAYHIVPPITTQAQLDARLEKERERGASAVRYMQNHPGLSSRLAAQDTLLNRFINWVFRMGGMVHRDNVLAWAQWARQRRLVALEKMWLAGVINQAHLESLHKAKRASRSS